MNQSAYHSHRFTGVSSGYVHGEPIEMIAVCEDCGCQDMGDPDEFPDLNYPECGGEDD